MRCTAHANSYPFISPYAYALNTPTNAIDPDGKDVYLVIWATSDGEVGHAGIAVENYKTIELYGPNGEYGGVITVPDGTFTYYDLWPNNDEGVGVTNANSDVEAYYGEKITTLKDITTTDVTGAEGRLPDGVIKLTTDYVTDGKTKAALKEFKEKNTNYNGVQCNCSDYAEEGIETAAGKQLDVNEDILNIYNSTTPNKLYQETSKLPNAVILIDAGNKVDKTFVEGAKESGGN